MIYFEFIADIYEDKLSMEWKNKYRVYSRYPIHLSNYEYLVIWAIILLKLVWHKVMSVERS